MSLPAARIALDMQICPQVTPPVPVPHVGGPIIGPGSINVIIGGSPASVMGDMAMCVGIPCNIIKGSMSVLLGNKPAVRIGDPTNHGGAVVTGFPTVLIGG